MALFYYNFQTNKRERVDFYFNENMNARIFKQIIDFSKFLTIPQIFKENFREYCQHDDGRVTME